MEIMIDRPTKTPFPAPADDGWPAAAARVERYLRAHGLTSPRQLQRLTAEIMGVARARARPGVEPVTLAMETMEAGLAAWLAPLLPARPVKSSRQLAHGRAALAMGEVPARWPEYFLRGGAVPAELQRVLRDADLARTPEIRFSNMAPRPQLASGRTSAAAKWQLSARWPFVRIVTGLVILLTVLGPAVASGS